MNGDAEARYHGNLNVSFAFIEGEVRLTLCSEACAVCCVLRVCVGVWCACAVRGVVCGVLCVLCSLDCGCVVVLCCAVYRRAPCLTLIPTSRS